MKPFSELTSAKSSLQFTSLVTETLNDDYIVKKIHLGAFRDPVVLTFKRKTNIFLTSPDKTSSHVNLFIRSTSHLTTATDRYIQKNTPKGLGRRVQIFKVKLQGKLNLLEGLPFQKYGKRLMQHPHFQVHIVEDELKLLYEKLKNLRSKLIEESKPKLFKTIRIENQQVFNAKLEETLGLLKEISKIILFEYADSIEECQIKPYPDLPNFVEVSSEAVTLKNNTSLLLEGIDAFKGAFATYKTLSRQQDRKPFNQKSSNALFQMLARMRLNISEFLEEIAFHENHQVQKSKLLDSILKLHSLPEVLNIQLGTAENLKKHQQTTEHEFFNSNNKTSKEIMQAMFDS